MNRYRFVSNPPNVGRIIKQGEIWYHKTNQEHSSLFIQTQPESDDKYVMVLAMDGVKSFYRIYRIKVADLLEKFSKVKE